MDALPRNALLDTNVILDFWLPGRPHTQDVTRAVNAMISHNLTLYYTVAQAKDIFFLASTAFKARARACDGVVSEETAHAINHLCWSLLDTLGSWMTVIGADESDLWLAGKYRAVHRDFEDDLLIAAAKRAHADFIVTNDEALIRHSPVAAITPCGMATLLEAFAAHDPVACPDD